MRRDGQELTHLNLTHNVRTKVGSLQYHAVLALLLGSLLLAGAQRSSAPRASAPPISTGWQETRFWTGCDPGPADAAPWPEPRPPQRQGGGTTLTAICE
jgi:hypothetical protein